MDMGEFDTKKFKSLKAKWDKRLADSGFDDIENEDGSMKLETNPRAIKNALKEKEEREIYYSIAREFLETYTFSTEIQRNIWALHCEGLGKLSIARELKVTAYRAENTVLEIQKLARLRK